MNKVAKIRKKRRLPKWLRVKIPKIISAKEISGLTEIEDKIGSGIVTGPAAPSIKLENDQALSYNLRKGLVHSDTQIKSIVSSEVANEKISESDWGKHIYIDKEKINDSMRYYVGGKLAAKSQISKLLIDFQYLINMYSGYGFPSILSSWYEENENEWGFHEDKDSKKKIEPDALLDKIFSVLSVYRLSFTVLERNPRFEKTVVIGMLSLIEPLLFVKKSLADNNKFQKQLERINFYLSCFYKIAILNKVPDDCPSDFLSLVSSVMHLMDNLDFSSIPNSVMKRAEPNFIEFLDDMEVPFRTLNQIDLISYLLNVAKIKDIEAVRDFKDQQSPGAIIMKSNANKLNMFAKELMYHRKFLNYNVKRASLWIYDYIIKNSVDDPEDEDQQECMGNMPGGAVIEMNPDDFSQDGVSSDFEKTDMGKVLGNALEGEFYSFNDSTDIDYLDPDMAKAISDFIDSMKKDTNKDLNYNKLSTSRVIDGKLDLNDKYKSSERSQKTAGNQPGEHTLSEIDLKKFYEENKPEIHHMKNTLGKLCNRYIVSNGKEGEINRSRIMRLIYDTLNGDESNNYKKNKKEGIFAHITIVRDISGSTTSIQDKITNTCLKFAMAADIVEGIFVRVIDFEDVAKIRKEFNEFVPSRMQINADGGTTLASALNLMEQEPDVMMGTHLHMICIMSDFCFYDNSPLHLAQTINRIARYSKHTSLLNVAFEHRDIERLDNFSDTVTSHGIRNVTSEVITEQRDIAQILAELVNNRLISIIRGRV